MSGDLTAAASSPRLVYGICCAFWSPPTSAPTLALAPQHKQRCPAPLLLLVSAHTLMDVMIGLRVVKAQVPCWWMTEGLAIWSAAAQPWAAAAAVAAALALPGRGIAA
eukprot:1150773-Pelagomonas_calceolata.AAC.6